MVLATDPHGSVGCRYVSGSREGAGEQQMLTFVGLPWAVSSSSVGRSKADEWSPTWRGCATASCGHRVPAHRTVELDGETR
jgi:hypothetical protein